MDDIAVAAPGERDLPGTDAVTTAIGALDGRLADTLARLDRLAALLRTAPAHLAELAREWGDLDWLGAEIRAAAMAAGGEVGAWAAREIREARKEGWDAREAAYQREQAEIAPPILKIAMGR